MADVLDRVHCRRRNGHLVDKHQRGGEDYHTKTVRSDSFGTVAVDAVGRDDCKMRRDDSQNVHENVRGVVELRTEQRADQFAGPVSE